MGYYFVCLALGNLFAGLLSVWVYTTIAKEMQQPLLMWGLFAVMGLVTAFCLLIVNNWLKRRQ